MHECKQGSINRRAELLAAAAPSPPEWFVNPSLEEQDDGQDRDKKVDAAIKAWRAGRVQILREEMERVERAEESPSRFESSSERPSKRSVSTLEHVVGEQLEGLQRGDLTTEKEAVAERTKRSQRRQHLTPAQHQSLSDLLPIGGGFAESRPTVSTIIFA